MIIIFIALIGLSLLLYPAVSQWVNDNYQSTVCAEYSDAVEELDDETAEEELRKADEYNEDLTESVKLLENPLMQSEAVDNGDYGNILNATAEGVMAYLEIPEINVMLPIYHGVEDSANFLFTLWKRVRKYGACVTGLTQNVEDLLQSHTARTMLANSEFLIMLNQAPTDRVELARLLNISDNQLSYITNVPAGRGLMKCGSAIVPFEDSFPKQTKLYAMMNTRPDETVS